MGGESGPDLTQSKIVLDDHGGDKIAAVVREGRQGGKQDAGIQFFQPGTGQPGGVYSCARAGRGGASGRTARRGRCRFADGQRGGRQGSTSTAAGGCAKCHSPTGDLAGIAQRYQGLELEMQMLYPRGAKSTVYGDDAHRARLTRERWRIWMSSPWGCAMQTACTTRGRPAGALQSEFAGGGARGAVSQVHR